METLGFLSFVIHIAAGSLTLLAGPVAIFYNFKHPRNHRLAGKIFFYAMLVVCATAVAGFLKHPERVFFQFLMGIAALVLVSIVRGVRAIRIMKGGAVTAFDLGYQSFMGLTGIAMLCLGTWHLQAGTGAVLSILFFVFGLASIADGAGNLRYYLRPAAVHALDWYHLHVRSMLGAFTASTTAFTVNAAPFLPWYLQWFGPTLLLMPLQIYFGRILRERKKQALLLSH